MAALQIMILKNTKTINLKTKMPYQEYRTELWGHSSVSLTHSIDSQCQFIDHKRSLKCPGWYIMMDTDFFITLL